MKLWAVSGIQTPFKNTSEYKVIGFGGVRDLCASIENESWRDIEELIVVAHGDLGGHVECAITPLTMDTIEPQREDLQRLGSYLRKQARVMFLACSCGIGGAGDLLLTRLSSIFAGCDVIGFVVSNKVYGPDPGRGCLHVFSDSSTRNDEWSEQAKWAKDGAVVRPALPEYTGFAERDPTLRNRCGSDNCHGHQRIAVNEHCDPYRRTSWPKWPVSVDEMTRIREAKALHDNSSHRSLGLELTMGVDRTDPRKARSIHKLQRTLAAPGT